MKPEELKAYKGKRVLITGAAGFIGRRLVEALTAVEARVFQAVRGKAGYNAAPDPSSLAQILTVDVAVADQVRDCLLQVRPEVIFNLAGKTGEDTSLNGLTEQWLATAGGAINVALAASEQNAPFLIQMGSSAEYGDGPTPFREDQPNRPLSTYAAAKAAATGFLLAVHRAGRLDVIVVRPTIVYGPGQTGEMLLPHLIQHYLDGRVPSLTSCEQTRDFLYIDDFVGGLLCLGLRRDLSGRLFNMSSGKDVPLRHVVEIAARLCNYRGDLGLSKRPYPAHEVMVHRSSSALIIKEVGWRPQIDIEEGLERTVAWWLSANSPILAERTKE